MNICVKLKKGQKNIVCTLGESLLEAMKKQDIYVPAYCGGRGTCGKCKIRVIEGVLDITVEDEKNFTRQELEEGYRLSCKAFPQNDVTIELCTEDESDFDVLVSDEILENLPEDSSYGVAIDIGTTTIAMELVGLNNKHVYDTSSRINHQRAFGADVISRIQASNNGEGEALRRCILNDLGEGIRNLITDSKIDATKIEKIVISANTTMGHLLMGYSCETLGVSPFTPVNIDIIRIDVAALFKGENSCAEGLPMTAEVVLLPGISTYVGADITAGLLVCGFDDNRDGASVLIDFGTNGEMAIGNCQRLITTSTAAGPAFEGGNISCGIGSVVGAIRAARFVNGVMEYETIGDGDAIGICGTGVMDITAELVAHEIVDETGLLDEDYFDDGVEIATTPDGDPIVFTQQDVREIQLAKAAVRAGIEVLMQRFGTTADAIDTVYLAGGFGFHMNVEKAMAIGLLPEEFAGKIKIAGNTSLLGAQACLLDEGALKRADEIAKRAEEISLGSDKAFNEFYMDSMFFE